MLLQEREKKSRRSYTQKIWCAVTNVNTRFFTDVTIEWGSDLAVFLASSESDGITGKLISAVWDDFEKWPDYLDRLNSSDIYTLRRIAGRDRGCDWGDK